jgi:hypothetical protein
LFLHLLTCVCIVCATFPWHTPFQVEPVLPFSSILLKRKHKR